MEKFKNQFWTRPGVTILTGTMISSLIYDRLHGKAEVASSNK